MKYFAGRRGGGYGVGWVGNMEVWAGEKRYEELQGKEECFIQLGLNKGIIHVTGILQGRMRKMKWVLCLSN
ncbi:hypothetical protein C1H46_000376 [Malus baccata]|uniref:Uncharacterized protein n=1 Tax=Malus baccata TaxID=106549 RepID=A0A540NSD9_MALBA|nr:hypothetical protein C1H46_000376 [Malus baccata]